MDDLTIRIDAALLRRWPETRLGALLFEARVTEAAPGLPERMAACLPALRARLETEPLAEWPNLAESRAAFRACGKDPGRYRVSSEALLRRIRQGKELYRINSVVDVNNLASLCSGFSFGSYDRDRLEGELALRIGEEGESYEGIGKGSVNLAGLPLLADARGPVGSPCSDSPRAMITETTRCCLCLAYGFGSRAALEEAVAAAARDFTELAGAVGMRTRIIEPEG